MDLLITSQKQASNSIKSGALLKSCMKYLTITKVKNASSYIKCTVCMYCMYASIDVYTLTHVKS